MKKKIILAVFVVSLLLAPLTATATIPVCYPWEIVSSTQVECVSEHCGIWSDTAESVTITYKRFCMTQFGPVWQYNDVTKQVDCDCYIAP